jgi:hypothetical protein
MVGGLNVHRLVADVASEMANELFEVYARENAIYKRLSRQWRDQREAGAAVLCQPRDAEAL